MGILDGIVEWFAQKAILTLDVLSTAILGSLGCDMEAFLRYFPAVETLYSVFCSSRNRTYPA